MDKERGGFMKFIIDHDTKRVLVSFKASMEELKLAQQSAKNHGYELVTVFYE